MGKVDSKFAGTESFDNIKSVKKSVGGHKKNTPISSTNRSYQGEKATSASNSKSSSHFVELTILVWLDASSEKTNDVTQKTINHFRRVTNIVQVYSDLEKCYQFMSSIQDEKILFVVSGSFGPQILSRIENFDQLYSAYIFCGNKANHIEWSKQYKKIKGIHTQIKDLCDALRYDNNQYDKSITPISILPSAPVIDLNQSNKEFIYLQMLKSILLEIQYDKKFRRELVDFSRQFYLSHEVQLNIIDTFEDAYNLHTPIWWYTRKCFIYKMLRRAFNDQDFELIYKLAFFIRDLHRDIKKSYLQTHNHQYHPISVYRAARMTAKEFEYVEKNHDGLLSFNDFLITTLERSIALKFANKLRNDPNVTVVIYKIDIDPSKSSIPFIALNNLSYVSDANGEILLSMNTIFHMDQIERISDRLYEITLSPANKKDEQVINLVDYMQEMTQGVSGWFRLTRILMDVNEYNQVENIYKYMYDQTNENQHEERAFLLHELGYVNDLKNDLLTSITNYQQAINIYLRYLPPNHPTLITTYTNLGSVLEKQGDFNGALNQYQRALKIEKPDEPDIIYQYNNIASALYQQGKFSEAQQTYEKAVEILLKDFPSAHPIFAETYNNMGGMFYSMRDYTKALGYYEKTLEIEEKSLPENHPSLISTCFNLATTYEALKNNKKAVTYAEKAYEKARTAYGSEHLETKQNLDYLEQLRNKTEIVKL